MRPLTSVEKQWLFPASALRQTPSQDHGLTYEQELQKRARAMDYIRSLAARTLLTYEDGVSDEHGGRARGVLTTASVLINRFYMRRSIKDFPIELMAATILFIASKVEEEPLKLRYIVNACLIKFENASKDKLWEPQSDHPPPPSNEYRRWENEILAAEEIAHETLCFDMTIEQPWPILQQGIKGLNNMWGDDDGPPLYVRDGEGQGKGAAFPDAGEAGEMSESELTRVTESSIREICWSILDELYLYPLSVLYHPSIIACATLYLALDLALPGNPALSSLLIKLLPHFELEADSDVDQVDSGRDYSSDLVLVTGCIEQIHDFAKVDIRIKDAPVLKGLLHWMHQRITDMDEDLQPVWTQLAQRQVKAETGLVVRA